MATKVFLVALREDPRERFLTSAKPLQSGESYVLRTESSPEPARTNMVELSPEGGDAILIVDDEFDMLQSLQTLVQLMLPQHHVLVAHNAKEALAILQREHVQLILADYKMPGMTGIQMMQEMERQNIRVPAFLLTAFADSNLEVEARKLPLVKGFFKKPIEPRSLIEAALKYCAPHGGHVPEGSA